MTRTILAFAGVLAGFSLLALGLSTRLEQASAAKTNPSAGYTIHIDAQKHFAAHPTEWAHHWCKPVAGGMLECAIFDSDKPDAHLVAVETVVGPKVYQSFSSDEKAKWHYHKTEIAKVNMKLPDMDAAAQKKLVAQMTPTYGKVYTLWDPMTSAQPVGDPSVSIVN